MSGVPPVGPPSDSPVRMSRIAALPGLTSKPRLLSSSDLAADADADLLAPFFDALDDLQSSRDSASESPRMSISSCPTNLIVEWQSLHAISRCEIGAGLTVLLLRGLETINDLPEIRAYDRILTTVRNLRASEMSLHYRSYLHKAIGTPKRPGLILRPTIPDGCEVETIQFRTHRLYYGRLTSRASELGMYLSTLAIVALGVGLCHFWDADPVTQAATDTDLDALSRAAKTQASNVTQLVALYRDMTRTEKQKRSQVAYIRRYR